jgi:predicted ABC-type ATPase
LPPVRSESPLLWIIAGPNGSGKSTFYQKTLLKSDDRPFWIINPDKLATEIWQREYGSRVAERDTANRDAVNRMYAWLEDSIRAYQTVGVETVLSTDKYRALVTAAKALGYEIHLFYVMLGSPERCVERVRLRVSTGGHPVPEQKIIERYWRSLKQLPWFLDAADVAGIYDNLLSEPKLMAEKENGVLAVYPSAFESIKEIARRLGAGL